MKYFKYLIYTLLVLLSLSAGVSAQSFRATQYTRNDGLQNELVKSISLDTLGVVWLATDEGIISYNGLNFSQFTTQLPSIYIKSIYRTSSGMLLCATDLGVIQINTTGNKTQFKILKTGTSTQTDTALWFPKLFFEDSNKRIWFSDNNSIWCINGSKTKRYAFSKENLTMSWQRSFSFVEDGFGNLYTFSHPGNLFVYQQDKDQFSAVEQHTASRFVSHCLAWSEGKILVASNQGVFLYFFDKNANLLKINTLIENIDASFLAKRNHNEVWVGTWNSGLYLLKNMEQQAQIVKITDYKPTIASYLYQNTNGDLWVAGDNGFALIQTYDCDALYQEQSKTYTQDIFQQSADLLYFTDGGTIFQVNPTQPYLPAKILISNTGKTYLSLTAVNEQLWASDATGGISIFENGKLLKYLDMSQNGAIYEMITDSEQNVWFCQDNINGVSRIDKNGTLSAYTQSKGISSRATALALSPDKQLYAGCTNNGKFLFVYDAKNDQFKNISKDFDFNQPREIIIHQLCFQKNTLWLGTSYGLAKYENNQCTKIDLGGALTHEAVKAVAVDKNGHLWFASSTGVIRLVENEKFLFDEIAGMPSKTVSFRGMITDSHNQIWIGTAAGLGFFSNKKPAPKTPKPYFVSIQNDEQDIHSLQRSFLNNSFFKFKFLTYSFPSKYLKYEWKLIGKHHDWQKVESLDGLFLSNLPSGDYRLEIRCRQNGNFTWSDSLIFDFHTHIAWYKTVWAFIAYFLFLVGLIYVIIKLYTHRLRKQKEHLEQVVRERTAEIIQQKEEILEQNSILEQQKEEIQAQADSLEDANKEITTQKEVIEKSHKDITNSILYAQRIQMAVLPDNKTITNLLPQHFIFFKPCNIVSGDFYFVKQIKQYTVIAAVDCTGHGVPGGFMSMLGIALLNEIVLHNNILSVNSILDELRNQIKYSLQQTGQTGEQQDGMDIALCVINQQTLEMSFAGAHNPCLIFRPIQLPESSKLPESLKLPESSKLSGSSELIILPADRMPVGVFLKERPFSQQNVQLQQGDTFYLFSDGYYSQFGGTFNIPLKSKSFKSFLSEICLLPMHKQKQMLENKFVEWKGENEQTDDVLVMGIRV